MDEAALPVPTTPPSLVAPRLLLITGLSGAGKSTAMRLFEDLGYYCIDNLPPALVRTFYDLYQRSGSLGAGVVVASDLRSGVLFDDFTTVVEELGRGGVGCEVLYLDCDTGTLVRRYTEARRVHPLKGDGSTEQAIEEERRRLQRVRGQATRIIDTSELSVAALREAIVRAFVEPETRHAVSLDVVSFGFKYGLPLDADFVFDVRFLPNPYYVPALAARSGEDGDVYAFVMGSPDADRFAERVRELIDVSIPGFVKVGKLRLTVAFGCTGGHHRSVAFARRLGRELVAAGHHAVVVHRDLLKRES